MNPLVIEALSSRTTAERTFEIVERKGLGHPDSICDAVMESAARGLARAYLETFGSLQHFNLDKGLLAAGSASPRFGGGTIEAPMKLVLGDRALYAARGRAVPVEKILVEAARDWFRSHLRYVDPEHDLLVQNEVRPGSSQLASLFATDVPRANDTSAATAFAPFTTTERIVLEVEAFLNPRALEARRLEVGEDVKVMAVRRGSALSLTVAAAFVDRFIDSEETYFRRKEELRQSLLELVTPRLSELETLTIDVNTLDEPGGGAASVYLTVTGTSAEGADSGQVGRGNRWSGLISSRRASSNEAVAGKNPQSHVGKIYNVVAQKIADRLVAIDGIREAAVHLVSRIGDPLESPHLAAVDLVLAKGASVGELASAVETAAEVELEAAPRFALEWIAGDGPNA
jgi:S-adenosylmethionine synthetase